MIGYHSTDTRTTTLADAGAFERMRDAGYDDRPSLSDCVDDRAAMEREARADAAARARGEYVPSCWTKTTRTFIAIHLSQHRVAGEVSIKRDGIFAVTGPDHAAIIAALANFDGDAVDRDDAVWVRSEDSRHDTPPF